jgi:hypothetical protein
MLCKSNHLSKSLSPPSWTCWLRQPIQGHRSSRLRPRPITVALRSLGVIPRPIAPNPRSATVGFVFIYSPVIALPLRAAGSSPAPER